MRRLGFLGLWLLMSCAPIAKEQLQPLPRRSVPSLQYVRQIEWKEVAAESAFVLHGRSVAQGVEQGGCLHGGVSHDTLLVVATVSSPAAVYLQVADTIAFECARDASYLGRVHTHSRVPLPSPTDVRALLSDRDAGVTAITGPQGIVVMTREGVLGFVGWRSW